MTEDYDDLLDQNVDEVKDSIRDMDDPDYQEILKMEQEGKDRKTIKEFIEPKIGESEVEEEDLDEMVEEIEEETEGGLLGSFQPEQVLVGGVIAGLIIGLLAGFAVNMDSTGNQAEVRDSMQELFSASGSSPDSLTVEESNGMFHVVVNNTATDENGTEQTSSQSFYVSPDGELLFPEIQSPFLTNPYRVDDLIQQSRQQQTENTTQ